MDLLVVSLALIVQITLLSICLSRYGFAPLPTLALVYIVVAQICLMLVRYEVVDYPFLDYYTRGGYTTYFVNVTLIMLSASVAIFAQFFKDIRAGRSSRMAMPHLDLRRIEPIISAANFGFGIFCLGFLGVMALVLDWSIVWFNTIYLLMTRPNEVVTVGRLGALLSLMPFIGILAAVFAAINVSMERKLPALFFGVVGLMISTYYVAAHQRVAILPPAAFFVVLAVAGQQRHLFLKLFSIAFTLFALTSALTGRGSRAHGLSTLPNVFTNIADANFFDLATGLVLNMTEGIFVLAESLVQDPTYATIYKVLSFSPLPSSIDKFQAANDLYQVRITQYVPLSGYSEAYFFGFAYISFLILFFFLAIRIYKKLLPKNQYVALACGLLILLAFVQLFAYPLRNGLKALWIATIVGSAALFYYRNHRPHQAKILPGLRAQGSAPVLGRARPVRSGTLTPAEERALHLVRRPR